MKHRMHYFSLNGVISTLSLELYQKCKFRHRAVYASARLHSLCECFFILSFGKPEDLRTKKKKKKKGQDQILINDGLELKFISSCFLNHHSSPI